MKGKACRFLLVFSGPPYAGTTVGLGTRHRKEEQLGPPFARILRARVRTPPGLDTDQFGAFTGEVPRTVAPLAAARGKARLAMQVTGLPLGLASEASYGPLAAVGVPGHEELLIFLDDELGIEVVEVTRSLSMPGAALRARTADDAVDRYLAGLGWPDQAVVVVPAQGDRGAAVAKGITDRDRLAAAVGAAARVSADGHALLQPDLRAHR
ncbi:DUF6671 family protein, partial [Actinotalea ferrariae]|uniref:DUF6671 family protein n=1 Tax=Actinotalea ferrariae TaxID=1386098 RepID=UPI0012DFD75F